MTIAAPTSTWVVFEEAEPEPLPVLSRVRVPQGDSDIKGAGFWIDWEYFPFSWTDDGEPVKILEAISDHLVVDLCEFDGAEGDVGRLAPWLSELAERASCPVGGVRSEVVSCVRILGDGTRVPCPEPVMSGEGRWMVVDESAVGVLHSVFATKKEAIDAAVEDRNLRALPYFARPLGFVANTGTAESPVGELGYGTIVYSDTEAPMDEVRVLDG